MAITSITSPASSSPAKDAITGLAVNPKAGQKTLGADDFMKLLTTQLTAQDPMNPMKDTEFIAQMANFSSLEQMRGLSKSFDTFAAEQKMTSAPSYLGRQVTVKDAGGDVTGTVDAITLKDQLPAIVIGGKSYNTNLITGITTAPPAPSTTTDIQNTLKQ